MGMRIASVSLTHTLEHAAADEMEQSTGKVLIGFNDTPATYSVSYPPELAMQFFRLCDGIHSYADIASSIQVNVDDLLEAASPLCKLGILDHAAPGVVANEADELEHR